MSLLRRLLATRRGWLGYAAALAARGLEVGGKFGLYSLAAARLGTHDAGLFFVGLTWASLAATAGRMGLERVILRQVAAEIGGGRGGTARRVGLRALGAIGAASLTIAGLTVLGAGPAAVALFGQPELAATLMASALVIPAQNVLWVLAYGLVGLNRGGASQLLLNALPSVLALAALLAGVSGAAGLLACFAAANALCALAAAALIARDWTTRLADRPDRQPAPPLPRLRTEARPFFVVEITLAVLLTLPTLLLGVFADPAAVSTFSIANRLSNLVGTVVLSIGTVAAPRLAEHARRGNFPALHRVARPARWLTAAVGLPLVAAMLVAPGAVMALLGSGFASAGPVLAVLALGQAVNTLFPFQDTILAMTEHGRVLRLLTLAQLAVCVALGLGLIPSFGAMGAAVATAAALSVYVGGCAWQVRRLVPG